MFFSLSLLEVILVVALLALFIWCLCSARQQRVLRKRLAGPALNSRNPLSLAVRDQLRDQIVTLSAIGPEPLWNLRMALFGYLNGAVIHLVDWEGRAPNSAVYELLWNSDEQVIERYREQLLAALRGDRSFQMFAARLGRLVQAGNVSSLVAAVSAQPAGWRMGSTCGSGVDTFLWHQPLWVITLSIMEHFGCVKAIKDRESAFSAFMDSWEQCLGVCAVSSAASDVRV